MNKNKDPYTELKSEKQVDAIYIIADIRNFSEWSNNNVNEVVRLLSYTYSLAYEHFGTLERHKYLCRVVKFLGDGFFAVREYDTDRKRSFERNLFNAIIDMEKYRNDFCNHIKTSLLHDKHLLGISFGLSYGIATRFYLSNFPFDYAGEKINLASRLCGEAQANEFCVEYDLLGHIKQFVSRNDFTKLNFHCEDADIKGFGQRQVIIINDIEV